MHAQPSFKTERINELIRRQLMLLLKQETRDPRLQTVRITDVFTTRDLSQAKIFYSVSPEQQANVVPLLKKAQGFFRSNLCKNINLRRTPELKFIFDPAPNIGARMDDLLSSIKN